MKVAAVLIAISMLSTLTLARCSQFLPPLHGNGTTEETSEVVSNPGTFTVPDVRGLYFSTAVDCVQADIDASGLKNVHVTYYWDQYNYDPEMNAKITRIDPAPGTVITADDGDVVILLGAGEQAPDFVTKTGN